MARSGLALLELALEHFARDDRLHDLDRTAGDLDDARISIGAADRIFPHIAPATEELETFIRRLAMQFRRHHLRSEEHTSELQSLMRNSYAVFCLKKKNTTTKKQ